MAIGSMTTNSTVDMIDKTLKTENAPADAKAVGDYILDAEGNVIFYSKAAVDELLKKKLDLTGGTMTGPINFSGGQNGSILSGEEDAANEPGKALNNIVIRSWWGVSFTTDCPNQTYTGKTAICIDCRDGIIKAPRFEGTADNGVVASGSNYVRFGDGTQICLGHIVFGKMEANSATLSRFVFAAPFLNTDYAIMSLQTGDVGGTNLLAINLIDKTTTDANVSVYNSKDWANNAGVIHDCIAIGRWK
nr:MAG TPA: hyaluronidase [Caudoviricetes sp.]